MIHQMLLAGDGNLLANGEFDSSGSWTLGSGWSISSGKATSTGAGSLTQALNQTSGDFEVVFTISGWAGTGAGVFVSLGSANGTVRSANGTYTETISSGSWANFGINPNTGTESFSVESVSVRRV